MQKVRLATELLSHTRATAIIKYSKQEEVPAIVDFIYLINSWFDLLSSYVPNKQYSEKLKSKIVAEKKSLQVFQKVITKSFKQFFSDLQLQCPSIKYIMTHRLNQDCLENLSQGGLNDRPSPINALNRLRMIIRVKSPCIVQNEFNTQDSATGSEEFTVSNVLKTAGIVAAAKGSMIMKMTLI
ncbi:hypothetical protein PR048_012679 [Dryococelus australis]|uniref:Uncharacterized protein n=1 Tax=Dryococelus australis TaxID=614101 RepID=A0ABQ9HQ18_9NEOP|nr:hypothetical protein PR048_012679 [Dryococelus australis]